jgi:hypothetical protein
MIGFVGPFRRWLAEDPLAAGAVTGIAAGAGR